MGIWSIGHDLGHHAFSEYEWLDDAIGFVVHSTFLTPYFSFKYSHRSHHAHTNSMEYDEVWIPKRKADTFYSEVLNNPLGNLFMTFVRLLLSFPMYFTFNIHGRPYNGFASHFYPQSPIFNDSERKQIWLSDAGMLVTFYALYKIAAATSATCIPHYHTMEATKAVKPILGDYYKYDDTPILEAFWRETKNCIYVEPDEGAEDSGVYWFRK
ncbi:hypothetical protein L1987_10801 [Smallanthus sonchifolius]|uniref:Uncharacterized protein n=1 Tax=Smallanthus sonchifolius TaxID=185202 RepID=A0ACB9J951_9ASTR|nr:hypothetical protein L1987_10801 [Smallanthus sonchifolius]